MGVLAEEHAKSAKFGGICLRCQHDLEARRDGGIWCTNPECWHHSHEPHRTTQALNIPDGVEL